jgi:hypothetical protein
MEQGLNLQSKRKKYIRELAEAENASKKAKALAEDLYALDLTVYSSDYCFESVIYNALAVSEIDSSIALHPEQINIISQIVNNDALIVSAPTSFGKTFCVFEYIAKYRPDNVVLIVPTLALVEEYYKKIIKKYRGSFEGYKVYTNISEDKEYDFTRRNIFVLTHDRVVQESILAKIEKIDFLVIDEVYKLETDRENDRVLVLNMAYYYLAQKAKKYVLLAPFIKEIQDCESLEKKPFFYRSDYSPVVNNVIPRRIIDSSDRFSECEELINNLEGHKTLIYFATVSGKYGMYKYISSVVANEPKIEHLPDEIEYFIQWASDEIHEEWCVITALKHGYLIHNGQIPVGTRIFQINQYGEQDGFNKMLCTSTLLEGVNTSAENIIIVQPARKNSKEGECFTSFDFYNLVGRTGRLNEHFVGNAYYIQGPNDAEFSFEDAVRSVRFEILDKTDDMDIQFKNISDNIDVSNFLERLGIDIDEYLDNIGTKVRFDTARKIFDRFEANKVALSDLLYNMTSNEQMGRYQLVKILMAISDGKDNKFEASIANKLLDRRRLKIKQVVDEIRTYFPSVEIDSLISTTIRIKNGYLEHQFYNRVGIIKYFCQKAGFEEKQVNVINEKIISAIEFLYFINVKNQKMLIDIGIYERDIEKIIKVIGDDFDDTTELKNRLVSNIDKLGAISYISSYVIQNLR